MDSWTYRSAVVGGSALVLGGGVHNDVGLLELKLMLSWVWLG
jgi:hypothetical protein